MKRHRDGNFRMLNWLSFRKNSDLSGMVIRSESNIEPILKFESNVKWHSYRIRVKC